MKFISTLLDRDIGVSHGLHSSTKQVLGFRCPRPLFSGTSVVLVDTPGFNDTDKSDAEIFDQIANWMAKMYVKCVPFKDLY